MNSARSVRTSVPLPSRFPSETWERGAGHTTPGSVLLPTPAPCWPMSGRRRRNHQDQVAPVKLAGHVSSRAARWHAGRRRIAVAVQVDDEVLQADVSSAAPPHSTIRKFGLVRDEQRICPGLHPAFSRPLLGERFIAVTACLKTSLARLCRQFQPLVEHLGSHWQPAAAGPARKGSRLRTVGAKIAGQKARAPGRCCRMTAPAPSPKGRRCYGPAS